MSPDSQLAQVVQHLVAQFVGCTGVASLLQMPSGQQLAHRQRIVTLTSYVLAVSHAADKLMRCYLQCSRVPLLPCRQAAACSAIHFVRRRELAVIEHRVSFLTMRIVYRPLTGVLRVARKRGHDGAGGSEPRRQSFAPQVWNHDAERKALQLPLACACIRSGFREPALQAG